jgi:hypothetical protein
MTEAIVTVVLVLIFALAAPSIFKRRRARGWIIGGNLKWPSREEIK